MSKAVFNQFQKICYPEVRVYRDLQRCPIFKNMSKIVIRCLFYGTSHEEYRTKGLINNGVGPTDFDFLYVIKGSMKFKLDQVKIDGIDCQIRSMFLTFVQGEYADLKTITDKRLKSLKAYDPK